MVERCRETFNWQLGKKTKQGKLPVPIISHDSKWMLKLPIFEDSVSVPNSPVLIIDLPFHWSGWVNIYSHSSSIHTESVPTWSFLVKPHFHDLNPPICCFNHILLWLNHDESRFFMVKPRSNHVKFTFFSMMKSRFLLVGSPCLMAKSLPFQAPQMASAGAPNRQLGARVKVLPPRPQCDSNTTPEPSSPSALCKEVIFHLVWIYTHRDSDIYIDIYYNTVYI